MTYCRYQQYHKADGKHQQKLRNNQPDDPSIRVRHGYQTDKHYCRTSEPSIGFRIAKKRFGERTMPQCHQRDNWHGNCGNCVDQKAAKTGTNKFEGYEQDGSR